MRGVWERGRFRLWCLWLRLRLRRVGARLQLEAPHGARLMGMPRLRLQRCGEGDGILRLSLGRDVRIGPDLVLEVWAQGSNELELGDAAVTSDWVVVELRSGSIRLADRVQLRSWTLLKSSGRLTVGSRGVISFHTTIHCAERVAVGDRVAIAERCTLVDSDHPHDGGDEYFLDKPVLTTPLEVGENSFIGAGAVVGRGARVGPRSVVAAGAVVRGGEYPGGRLLAGVPATAIRSLQSQAAS